MHRLKLYYYSYNDIVNFINVDSKRLLDVEQKFKLAGVIALNVTTDGMVNNIEFNFLTVS